MNRRSLRVLMWTGLGLSLIPLLNLFFAPASGSNRCCSAAHLFNMDLVLRGVSAGLYRWGISMDPQEAVIGRSNWVYLGDRFERSVSTNRRAGNANDVKQGEVFAAGAARWDAFLRRNGVKTFQIMVAPNKESIYPENLPDWAAPGVPDVTDALFRGIGDSVFHDFRQPLLAAKQRDPTHLFYQHDTHWNAWGASHAFRAFADRMRAELPGLRWPQDDHYRLLRVERRTGGDLADFLRMGSWSPQDEEPILGFTAMPRELVQTVYGLNQSVDLERVADSRVSLAHPVQTRNALAMNKVRVLWLSDSFGGSMADLMHASFSDVVRMHWRDAFRDGGSLVRLLDEWKPDYVFVTVVERAFRGATFPSFLDYAPVAESVPAIVQGPPSAFVVSGMSGLERDARDHSLRVTSRSPSLILSLPTEVRVEAMARFSLALTCLDGSASLPVQAFWKSADAAKFHRDHSARFLHIGRRTVLDLDGAPGHQLPSQVKDIRLDLRGQGFCEHFRLEGLDYRPLSAVSANAVVQR